MSNDLLKNNPMHNTNMYAEGKLPTPQPGEKDPYGLGHRPGELVVQQLLQFAFQSVSDLLKDPSTNYQFDKIFTFFEESRLDAFKQWFASTKFEVKANFPKEEYPLPIVAIDPREEREPADTQVFGSEMVGIDNPHDKSVTATSTEVVGHFINQTLDIIVITDDPTTTIMLYRLIWYIVFANKLELEAYADFHNLLMSGSRMQFDAQTFPNWQYNRVLTLNYLGLFDFALHKMRAPMAVRFSALFKVGDFAVASQPADPGGLIATTEEDQTCCPSCGRQLG